MSNSKAPDAWSRFMTGYYFQTLRALGWSGTPLTGRRYLRAERLLKRFRSRKEAELRRSVLETLRARWEQRQAEGYSLEQALADSLSELKGSS
jgi:hypothetical protein